MKKMKEVKGHESFSDAANELVEKSQVFDDGHVIAQKVTEDYALYNADTCAAIKNIPDESIGFTIYSPPFRSLYTYSNLLQDMGNASGDKFDQHFEFIIPHLLRITKSGRNMSFHCMNLPRSKCKDGFIGINDFRGQMIALLEKHGWIFHSEVCIWKDPVTAMQRTKAMGLLHKQIRKDSVMSRQGIPDYMITMRKSGENKEPIAREYGFTEYAGTNPPNCDDDIWSNGAKGKRSRPKGYRQVSMIDGKWPSKNPFAPGSDAAVTWSIAAWQRYASPVWMDIDPGDTLQSMREDDDVRHICPLQLQAIERSIHLWSNPDDVVFTPFMGIGSEVYEAVRLGRKGVGCELKTAYFDQAVKNLDSLEDSKRQKELYE